MPGNHRHTAASKIDCYESDQWTKKLRLAFQVQRSSARTRDIEWLLTPEEWLKIWLDSGKIEFRGRTIGSYVMSRFGDTGPYSIDNVEIKTHGSNISEAHLGKPKEFSESHKRNMSNARKARSARR